MISSALPYFNGALTIMEGTLNTLGYLPKEGYYKLNQKAARFRLNFGKIQAITGLALSAIGYLLKTTQEQHKPLHPVERMIEIGLLYANHGILNMIRSCIESQGWGSLTAAYDFYGRKFMPSLAPRFDYQSQLFDYIKYQLDRISFVTFIPPQFVVTDPLNP